MKKAVDMRTEPIKTMIALGESTTWGYSVSDKSKCWVNRLAGMLQEYQGEAIRFINQGIGSNVLTTLCPAYEASAKPSALERLESEVLAHNPDLLILSYGLNDSRGGTSAEVFRVEYQKLIDIVKAGSDALIVLVNVYYMHECTYTMYPPWTHSDYNLAELYNLMIEQLAADNNLILADIYASEQGVDWFIDEDHCHPNDLGHHIIANKTFEAIARKASFVARTMPQKTLIMDFVDKYGNGPEIPAHAGSTSDIVFDKEKSRSVEG